VSCGPDNVGSAGCSFIPRASFQSLLATVIGSTPACVHHARSSRAVYRTVMSSTEWDRELIADLTAKRAWLRECKVMWIRALAAADEASLLGYEPRCALLR
jgi:hypothetical protein